MTETAGSEFVQVNHLGATAVGRASGPPRPNRQPGRQLGLLWGSAVLGALVLSPLASYLAGRLWACPLKSLTGIPCPTCGTTRSALLLAEFRPLEALVTYPLPTLGWFAFFGGGLVAGALALAGRPLPTLPRRAHGPLRWVLGFGLLAGWAWAIATGV